jgi:hypothetical protein
MRGIERYEWRTEHWPEELEDEAAHVQRPRPAKGHQTTLYWAKKGVKMRELGKTKKYCRLTPTVKRP